MSFVLSSKSKQLFVVKKKKKLQNVKYGLKKKNQNKYWVEMLLNFEEKNGRNE